ncbi:hypothetical protein AAMO2058_000071700 [Amorphochlora amoebiformis]
MVDDPGEGACQRKGRPRPVLASLNLWQKMFLVDGPLIMISSYAFLLLTSLAWRNGRIWAGIMYSILYHFLWTAATFYWWRIVNPEMFAHRNFRKWTLGLSLLRSVCIVFQFLLTSAQGPFIYLAAVIESVSFSWCNNLVFIYLHCRDNGFIPRFRQKDIFTILIYFQILLSALSGFFQVFQNWAHDFLISTICVYATVVSLAIIFFVGQKVRKSRKVKLEKSDKLAVLYMVAFSSTNGIVAIIAIMRYFRRALENSGIYEPIYGLLMFYFTSFLLISIIWELLDLVPKKNRESLQLLLVSAQYFQEFSVGIIFLEEGLNPRFAGLVSLVVVYDFLTESGLVYEQYFIWFKTIQTFKSKAIYMAKK